MPHPASAIRRAADAQARLAAIVESSDAAIVSTDPDWVVESWNPAAERLFGYTAAEIVGRSILELVPPDEHPQAREVIERVRAGGRVSPYEAVRRHKDGRPVHVSVNPWPVRSADGRFISLAAIYTDLAERRRLEEQLRQAQKMEAVGRLAGGIAHDFNNLLTVINGYADILLNQLPAADPARELLDEIRKAGERSAGLTRQLLAFSRKSVLAPQVFDPNALVLDMEKMLRRLIGEDIDLAVRLRPGVGQVRADPGLVEQVVLNLAVNARDAMPTGGKLTVETRDVTLDEEYARGKVGVEPGRYVLLAVADTGTGIPPEVLPHVFEPFFTTKGAGRGTGLGLATVHGIVKQAGGHVGVYTEVGVGTTFKVYLPRHGSGGPAGPGRSDLIPPARGTETVLLVEDEESVRRLAGIILRKAGYTVLECGTGVGAVRLASGHPGPLHLLVTDVVMPEMGGRELAGRVAAARPGVKVLFLSGYTDDAVVRHGVLEEHVRFLQKPFTPAALARAVRKALNG